MDFLFTDAKRGEGLVQQAHLLLLAAKRFAELAVWIVNPFLSISAYILLTSLGIILESKRNKRLRELEIKKRKCAREKKFRKNMAP